MNKRWFGYMAWLLLAACLYFFENGTGTRIILACSLLFPLLPLLRDAFFSADRQEINKEIRPLTVRSFFPRESDDPGDVRRYQPGDPVRRIHWKLSAKKGDVLVRETAMEAVPEQETRAALSPASKSKASPAIRPAGWLFALMLLCIALLLMIPEASRGFQALCNRLFSASEAVNAYAYMRFPVPESQNTLPAVLLLVCLGALLLALTVLLPSRLPAWGIMAACTLFQVYFGLTLPLGAMLLLYGLLGLRMMRRPYVRRQLLAYGAFLLAVTLLVTLLIPGVDAATETASEAVRDHLSRLAQPITGTAAPDAQGETETRRVHSRALETGEQEAQTARKYRLTTVGKEFISRPRWVDTLKIILLLLLSAALVSLPFAPFLVLNARKKKAQEARLAFASDDVSEAVLAIFRQVIIWQEAAGNGAGNLLYRDWAGRLPEGMPPGYAARFSQCAQDFEAASYGRRPLPEEKRQRALSLLKETEAALWQKAGWKRRLYLKYWMCLCE